MTAHPGILIVDDEPLNITLYSEMLRQDGYRIIQAADGISAVQQAQNEDPDIIVMDWNMPRLSGLGSVETDQGK
jgi:CheY-like chemotaxis protein